MPSASWHREQVRESRGFAGRLLRAALSLAALPYGWVVKRRNADYDSGRRPIYHAGVPVISVGNITVGGTGKTPLVAWLAQLLAAQGRRVALVSRGYGAARGRPNDEALELADRLPSVPHVQNRDRVAAAKVAIEMHHAEVLVLDDAFQHRRLHRDLDLVLLDALDPFGGGHLLPRGLLREPLDHLRRADAVILTRSDLIDDAQRHEIRAEVARRAPHAVWLESVVRPTSLWQRPESASERPDGPAAPPQVHQLANLTGRRTAAFCAIGNPAGFRRTLESAGFTVAALREFPDHHRFSDADLASLDDWVRRQPDIDAVLCTHKDWVKLRRSRLGDRPLYALAIELAWRSGEEALKSLVARALANSTACPTPAETR
ncbi:MAG: tetraacyldisaccharide 4'-kinase [Pirellulales bacterium]